MAFLFEQDRGLTQITDPHPHIGPGTYNTEYQSIQNNHGYAPFLSTGQKIVSLVDKQKVKEPGPGSYEVSKPIGDSGVQAYMNKQTIIVKVQGNGSSAFRSNQDRFKQTSTQNPGPGQYNWELQGKQGKGFKPQADEPKKNPVLEDIRTLNNQRKIQSIPQSNGRPEKLFQDIESFAKEQASQPPQQHNSRLGPGAYDIQQSIGDRNRGIPWSLQKTQRFEQKHTTAIAVGPGKYNLNKRVVPSFKRNASPGFISESVRSHFDSMIYNTNSELKAELRRRTGYKDSEVPGPGQYDTKVESIKIGSKAREFQFFGSSLERFQNNYNSVIPSANLGPGSYNLNNSFDQLHKKKNYVNHTFMSTKPKEEVQSETEMQPGPGSYNQNWSTMKQQIIKKFTQGYKGSFGCTQKRFENQIEIKDVGPGKYEVTGGQQGGNSITSAFKSNIQRGRSQDKNRDVPSIGQYEINQYNISTKMNKQANFLKNLRKIDVVKPGFDSGQPRFKESDMSLGEINVNPITNDQSYSVPKNYTKQSNVGFSSKTKRMDYTQISNTPGVGQYQVDQNNWKRPSYNTHYNRILEDI